MIDAKKRIPKHRVFYWCHVELSKRDHTRLVSVIKRRGYTAMQPFVRDAINAKLVEFKVKPVRPFAYD